MTFPLNNQAFEPDPVWTGDFSSNQRFDFNFSPRASYQSDFLGQSFPRLPSPIRGAAASPGGSSALLYQSIAPFFPGPSWGSGSVGVLLDDQNPWAPLPNSTATARDSVFEVQPANALDEDVLDGDVFGFEDLDAQDDIGERRPKRTRKNVSLWDEQKERIRQLYLDEGKSVEDTKECMKQQFGFDASIGAYKTKFNQWGFVKNLSRERANWMLVKASRRKEEEQKETVFQIGGRTWTTDRVQQTLKRTRGDMGIERIISSPQDIRCFTPMLPSNSPLRTFSRVAERPRSAIFSSMLPPELPPIQSLLTKWNAPPVIDSAAMLQEARDLDARGYFEGAEKAYLQTLGDLRSRYSHQPCHDETIAVLYALADFYGRYKRMEKADGVLDRLWSEHERAFGKAHANTIEHALHVAGLLESWSRPGDASAALMRVVTSFRCMLPDNIDVFQSGADSEGVQSEVQGNLEGSDVQSVLDERSQQLLSDVFQKYERTSDRLSVQVCKLLSLHIDAYRHLQHREKLSSALDQAKDAITNSLRHDQSMSPPLLQEVFGLAGRFVQNDRVSDADIMFSELEYVCLKWKSEPTEDCIYFMICVGMLFQEYSWRTARVRFERALASTMSLKHKSCNVTAVLEATLREKRWVHSVSSDGQWQRSQHDCCTLSCRLQDLTGLRKITALAEAIFSYDPDVLYVTKPN